VRRPKEREGRVSEGAEARSAAAAAETDRPTAVRSMLLPPNQLERFYAGGARIDRLRCRRGNRGGGSETWVGSTTTTFGDDYEGLSRMADGRLAMDVNEAMPQELLVSDGHSVTSGETALVPHAAGTTTLEGSATVIRCLPPAVDAGVGQW
jgi:hypothetical protein